MDDLTRTFATNLRAMRLDQKLSQQDLASRAKLSVSYVSMLERGERSPPFPTLSAVAKALRVHPTYLLQELALGKKLPKDLRARARAKRAALR
jgi:transcriptional regulator with XRE-family HTH domain